MTNYFRVTGYLPEENISFIIDAYGKFDKKWQLGSYMVQKNVEIIDITDDEHFKDVNISKAEQDTNKILLRAYAEGRPEKIKQNIDGNIYDAIKVNDKIYLITDI